MALSVRDVMTSEPVCIDPHTTVTDAARRMSDYNIGDVLVTDASGLRGVITDRDIVVRAVAMGGSPDDITVGDIVSPDPVCVSTSDPVSHAVELMRDNALRRLPVVDDGEVVGIVTLGDLARSQDSRSALADISSAPANH